MGIYYPCGCWHLCFKKIPQFLDGFNPIISKYATVVGVEVVSSLKGYCNTSYFIERNGK